MMPRQLVLSRHGFTTGNLAWRLAREGDLSLLDEFLDRPADRAGLTETGEQQMVILGEWLRKERFVFDRMYVSPLKRARQSAKMLKLPGKWIKSEYLREQRLGILEMVTPEERGQYLDSLEGKPHLRDPFNFAPLRGESFADIAAERAGPFLEMLERECSGDESVLVMGHSGTNKMLDCIIRQWTPREFVAHHVRGDNKIFNGMVLHYTRLNPETGEEFPTLDWVRTCCPWFDPKPSKWQKIDREPPGPITRSLALLREFLSPKPVA